MKMKVSYKKPVIFTSMGKIGIVDIDGTCEYYPSIDIPNQVWWNIGPAIGDSMSFILGSSEDMTMSKIIEGETLKHIWIYDFLNGNITKILDEEPIANSIDCNGILSDKKLLVSALIEGESRLFFIGIDGKNKLEITGEGEGFAYCPSISPDEKSIAFHITNSKKSMIRGNNRFIPTGYSINAYTINTNERMLTASDPDYLFFGPAWSYDSSWLAYLGCYYKKDRAHFGADIFISKPDGTKRKKITQDQGHWFGTSYGSEYNRGGGSNVIQWSPSENKILYTRITEGSHPDYYFDESLPNHEEQVYRPELAKGGTQICSIDPFSNEVEELTGVEEGKWEHHPCYSQDGLYVLYRKSYIGRDSELWIMDKNGNNQKCLSKGFANKGNFGYVFMDGPKV